MVSLGHSGLKDIYGHMITEMSVGLPFLKKKSIALEYCSFVESVFQFAGWMIGLQLQKKFFGKCGSIIISASACLFVICPVRNFWNVIFEFTIRVNYRATDEQLDNNMQKTTTKAATNEKTKGRLIFVAKALDAESPSN